METGASVVVTGGTGFVGRWVIQILLEKGYRPFVWLRPESDWRVLEGVEGWQRFSPDDPFPANAAPAAWLELGWQGVAGQERDDPSQVWENLPRILRNIQTAHRLGCRYWLGMGSQAEYGNLNRIIHEDDLPRPTTLYGKAKLAALHTAMAACASLNMGCGWLRLFSTYGPGDRSHWLIPYLIRTFREGIAPEVTLCEQVWDYLYIEDVARGVVAAMEAEVAGVYNLGSGVGVPLRRVMDTLCAAIGADCPQPKYGAVPYRPDQVMHMQADISRLQQAANWRPTVSLAEGLEKTVTAFSE